MSLLTVFALSATGAAVGARATATPSDPVPQQSRLLARSVLPASAVRAGSPPSGAFFTAGNRTNAADNGVPGPATGAYLAQQPVQA